MRWTEHIGRTARCAASSEYQISGDFDADDLERLGYPVARYAQGRIGVTVTGQGRGFDVDNARIDLDLRNAAVELPRAFWTKRAGQAASARFNVQRQSDGGLAFNDIDARGGGLIGARPRAADARQRIAGSGSDAARRSKAAPTRASTATRAQDGGLDVSVRGALFDAAPFMGSERAAGRQQPRRQLRRSRRARAIPAPMRASVVVDRLKMRGGATLERRATCKS